MGIPRYSYFLEDALDLHGFNLTDANLSGADLRGTDLRGTGYSATAADMDDALVDAQTLFSQAHDETEESRNKNILLDQVKSLIASSGDTDSAYAMPLSSATLSAVKSMEQAHRRDSQVIGLTTGLRALDRMLGGWQRSNLYVLAGRPSMGKSSLAVGFAHNAAAAISEVPPEDENRELTPLVLYFSMEMSAEDISFRIISKLTRIPTHKMRRGDLIDDDFLHVASITQEITGMPLYIDDSPSLSITEIRLIPLSQVVRFHRPRRVRRRPDACR